MKNAPKQLKTPESNPILKLPEESYFINKGLDSS